jgi:glycosyltransferase involved in cell wall biosynthesis
MKKESVKYSVVLPIYNEEKNILPLYKELKEVMNSLKESYEIIFVNDGSTDNSLEELKSLKNIKIINLSRNYGQSTAFDAGFKNAKGEIIITLDGDGQNNPKDILRLIHKLKNENLDIVGGWRKNRVGKRTIKILSKIGKTLRNFLIRDKIKDSGCSLRVYKKKTLEQLELQGEMHRYLPAIISWKGFVIGEIEVEDRKRKNGKSKYNLKKAVSGFLDLVYLWFLQKYSQRPLHLFGSVGITSIFLGSLSGIYSLYRKLFQDINLNKDGFFFLGFFLILMGIILFSFGIVIDLLIKINLNNSNNEKRYYIRETIEL